MVKRARGTIRIGVSGWLYRELRGHFYPAGLKPADVLPFYARHFRTVEVNSTFYGLPAATLFERWRERTPPGFEFSLKASRVITHVKRLVDCGTEVDRLLERASGLAEKLGPTLFQLPPSFAPSPERLASLLERLPARHRYAIELRDPRWITPETLALLRARGVAFCVYDLNGFLSPAHVTGDFVYVRLHGPGVPYRGRYSPEALDRWAAQVERWAASGLDVYFYFDNTIDGGAPGDALELERRLGLLSGIRPRSRETDFAA